MNDIQEGWQVDVKDNPDILPVQPDKTWFHGTRTTPFDTPGSKHLLHAKAVQSRNVRQLRILPASRHPDRLTTHPRSQRLHPRWRAVLAPRPPVQPIPGHGR